MNNSAIKLSGIAYVINLLLVAGFAIFMVWLVTLLWSEGLYPLASAISAITVFLVLTYIRQRFTPLKWLAIGIALALLFTLYPLLYTLYLSVTNMGSGHLMSQTTGYL